MDPKQYGITLNGIEYIVSVREITPEPVAPEPDPEPPINDSNYEETPSDYTESGDNTEPNDPVEEIMTDQVQTDSNTPESSYTENNVENNE